MTGTRQPEDDSVSAQRDKEIAGELFYFDLAAKKSYPVGKERYRKKVLYFPRTEALWLIPAKQEKITQHIIWIPSKRSPKRSRGIKKSGRWLFPMAHLMVMYMEEDTDAKEYHVYALDNGGKGKDSLYQNTG